MNTYLAYARRHNGSPLGGFWLGGDQVMRPGGITRLTIWSGGLEKGFRLWKVCEVELLEMISRAGMTKSD